MLVRADSLADSIGALGLVESSDLLPTGLTQRLRTFGQTIRPSPTVAAETVLVAQRAMAAVARHRFATASQVDTARMAVRLLRWLSTTDGEVPATLLDALHRQVREDAWVDRARLDVFAGVTDPHLAEAYGRLYGVVDERRRRHDEQFATQLAAATAADSEPGTLLRVEDVLDRVVRPILNRRRVLLLVLDGMSTGAATELAESLTHAGPWLELTPAGGPRTGVLAALPTVTEVSRCSLLSGRIAVGQQKEEAAALYQRFPGSLLLHKAKLRAGAGAAFDPEVIAAVEDAFVPARRGRGQHHRRRAGPGRPGHHRVGQGEHQRGAGSARPSRRTGWWCWSPITATWSTAAPRRSPGRRRPARTGGAPPPRRPVTASWPFSGPGLPWAAARVVLPWREELRYGPRKAGYHGGAAPAEVVIPLIVLSAGVEDAVPGWNPAPVASPAWWREPVAEHVAPEPAPAEQRRRPARQPSQDTALFDLPSQEDAVPPAGPEIVTPQPEARPALVEALLASEIYLQRRATDPRALRDDRVAALLTVLLAGGGRATMETLAADALVPAHRIGGTVTALRRLLQVEGYPVVEIDADGYDRQAQRAPADRTVPPGPADHGRPAMTAEVLFPGEAAV